MRYKILKVLKHNGVDYSIGSEADFNDEEVNQLVIDGTLEAIAVPEPTVEEPKEEVVKTTTRRKRK